MEYDEEEEEEYDEEEEGEEIAKNNDRYTEDLRRSENFEVGDYPFPGTICPRRPGDRLQFYTGVPLVAKIYDSSHPDPDLEHIELDKLLCFSRLAMAFYNIRMGTCFRVVKVLMATAHGISVRSNYVTFEAETNMGGSVTFQTKLLVFHPNSPCPKFEILFVRIKPDHNIKSKNSQLSEFDHNAQVVEDFQSSEFDHNAPVVDGRDRLSQLINEYTIDSRLDSQYSLALYLSQYALISHNLHVLSLSDVAKHDIESVKVLKLVKPDSEVPTYLITFEASVHAETEKKSVETFETKICMPTLFPTTTIELRSEARVITGMANTFTSLLNDGTYNDGVNFYSEPSHASQECSQQIPSKQKKGRSKNFLLNEDMLLLSGWLNISTDPVQGNNQTQATYWNNIWNYFHEHKNFESNRTPTSLCNRWSAINTSVSKFIGFYNQICGRNQSDVTEQDQIGQAMSMYESIMKEKFLFIRHWHELRHSPKYAASLAKKTKVTPKDSQPSSPSIDSPLSINHESESGLERPIGKKAAKKIKRAAYEATDRECLELLKSMRTDALAIASSRSDLINRSLQLQQEMMLMQKEEQERQKQIMELQKEKLKLRLAKEDRERQKEEQERLKEERERQVYEASIMAMDTTTMTPDQANYYNALKARIMRNIL